MAEPPQILHWRLKAMALAAEPPQILHRLLWRLRSQMEENHLALASHAIVLADGGAAADLASARSLQMLAPTHFWQRFFRRL